MELGVNTLIRFKHFWPGFDVNDNFVVNVLKGQCLDREISVESVFERKISRLVRTKIDQAGFGGFPWSKTSGNPRRIWYTGENLRPPVTKQFDAFISFDQDSFGGVNTYFPLFYVELLFGAKLSALRRGVSITDPNQLLDSRPARSEPPKFVCAFLSNPEPTRLRAIAELEKFGEVEIFGPYVGRPVPSKYEIAKNFKFCLAFENDLFPGYVTEKLLDAYVCGTVPLYWGDLGQEPHINRASFINAKDFGSLVEFASYVSNLSGLEYAQIHREPLLHSVPSPKPLLKALLGN